MTKFAKFLPLSLLALTASALPQGGTTAAPASPTVTIASGVVVGKTTTVSNQPSVTAKVNAYLGVPFAQSPPLRFAPPQAAAAWSKPLQATTLPPACIQQFSGSGQTQALTKAYFNNPTGAPPAESEDCLYLNVFAPANATSTSSLPVLFWIFGGNLQFGTGSLDQYDGSSLAATQNVVVVTINYRTNIFGFSNSPEIPFGQQNAGLLDQRFALQWVYDNIKPFGGNPDAITLFGESAGGESVKQIIASPPKTPIHAAIMESEQTAIVGNGLVNYGNVLAHFGCLSLACLRQVAATDIKSYIEANSLGFPPVVGDGTFLRDTRASITTGQFAKIPILMGTNLNEARVFLAVAGVNGNGTEALAYVFNTYGITNSTAQKSIIAAYAAQGYTDTYDIADRILTDLIFTCTTSNLASYLAGSGFNVHRYQYEPSFPTTSFFSNSGAYHASEIPEVFGTYPLSNQFGTVTPQQIGLSAYMQATWAGFAKGQSPDWPQVTVLPGNYLGELGAGSSTGVTVVNSATVDYACPLYAPLEDVLGISY